MRKPSMPIFPAPWRLLQTHAQVISIWCRTSARIALESPYCRLSFISNTNRIANQAIWKARGLLPVRYRETGMGMSAGALLLAPCLRRLEQSKTRGSTTPLESFRTLGSRRRPVSGRKKSALARLAGVSGGAGGLRRSTSAMGRRVQSVSCQRRGQPGTERAPGASAPESHLLQHAVQRLGESGDRAIDVVQFVEAEQSNAESLEKVGS